jgi:DnaJ-class molecular chaperone
LLGATKNDSEAEIKKLYKKAALKWHPDRWSNKPEEEQKNAEATFQKINRAFEVLSDPEKKQRYDAGVDESDLDNEHAGHSHGHGGMSPEMMHMFMRQHMGGGGGFGGGGFPF